VGFRKSPRLATRYIEIPLDHSASLIEPILMQNIADDEVSRLLVGRVDDPELGPLEATAYFNFSPPIQPVFPTDAATFQKIELILKFDYYSYGSTDSTDMLLEVHELVEPLTPERLYYSGTYVGYDPVPLGDTIFAVGPEALAEGWNLLSDNDATNNIHFNQSVTLSDALGESLLYDLINNRNVIDDFQAFSSEYRGFALTMPVSDKILGITPVYTLPTPALEDSRIKMTYKEGNGQTQVVDFPIYYASVNSVLNPVVTYTHLAVDRTGTPLEGIEPFADLVTPDGNLYAQSGTGIISKFDLTKLYDYFDTVSFPAINSAELVLDNTSTGRPPQTIELLLMDETNRFRGIYIDTVINGQEVKFEDPYLRKLAVAEVIAPYAVGGDETRVAIVNALTLGTVRVDPITGDIGPTIMTEFFQQVIANKSSPHRAKAFGLHPLDTEFKKTVSALKMSPGSARLKIYYSVPITGLP